MVATLHTLAGAALQPATKSRYGQAGVKLANFIVRVLRSVNDDAFSTVAGLTQPEAPWGTILPSHTGSTRDEGLYKPSSRVIAGNRLFIGEVWFKPEVLAHLIGSEVLVAAFLASLYRDGFSFATARANVFALRSCCRVIGVPAPPPFSPAVEHMLAGYKKLAPAGPPQQHVSVETLLSFLRVLSQRREGLEPHDARVGLALMMSAALTVAFAACLRPGEYTGQALRWGDVRFYTASADRAQDPAGSVMALTLRHTKASPTVPVVVRLLATQAATCPVRAATAYVSWQRAHGASAAIGAEAPFFASASGKALSYSDISRILPALARAAGAPEAVCSSLRPKGLRSGGATTAVSGGAALADVRAVALGRWSSDVVRVYLRQQATDQQAANAQHAMAAAATAVVTALTIPVSRSSPRDSPNCPPR